MHTADNSTKETRCTIKLAVLLVLVIVSAIGAATLSFEQLNWRGSQTSTPNSEWGRVRLEFSGFANTQYFNLNVDDQWVVRNMSVGSLCGAGKANVLTATFDLGVPSGTDVTNLNYLYSFSPSPSASMPAGTLTGAAVAELDYQIGGEDDVDLGSPGKPAERPTGTATVTKSAKLPDIDKFNNQEQEPNHCAPGAISNSLKYLQARKKLPSDVPTGISDVAGVVGTTSTGTPADWPTKKKDYYYTPGHGGVTTTFINGITPADINSLMDQISAGKDVELDLEGHVAVVAGVRVKSDGTVELDIFDDNQAADGNDPMRTVIIDVNGCVDGMKVERFVIETTTYTVLDSFNAYSTSMELRNKWTPMGNASVNLATNQSYTGTKSMQLVYSNGSFPYYSEACYTYDGTYGQNFNADNNTKLKLWLNGTIPSGVQMYVTLEDTSYHNHKIVLQPDSSISPWRSCEIELDEFGGVDIEQIKKLTIGVGDGIYPGGSGNVYIDDFILRQVDRPGADLNYDDVVNFEDLAELCGSWLWER